MQYRKEIDGLRALAVVPVILFHAGFESFSGGYIGVDIFFVISGYLITSIILAEQQQATFSLLGFYERRARRILPALFLVMLACLPVAWFSMLPDMLENFGQSLVATVLFSNNILLWLTSGYFALESEFKPLLHTWTLGVEEQYYILIPLVLMLLFRFGKFWVLTTLCAMAAASLLFADIALQVSPDAAFYLLPARGWELLVGSLTAALQFHGLLDGAKWKRRSTTELASGAGLALILISIFTFDKNTAFPGFGALLPVMGADLVILFATDKTQVGKLLANRVLVGLGLISYSAYLWHQPLLAFARLRSLEQPSRLEFGGLVALTFVLAFLTWKFVEQPFRRRSVIGRSKLFATTAFIGATLSLSGYVLYINSGFVNLWDELGAEARSAGRRLNAVYNEEPYRYLDLPFADPAKPNVLVMGNSFARDFINAGLENGYFAHHNISYSEALPSCMKSEKEMDPTLRAEIAHADDVIIATNTFAADCWVSDIRIYEHLGAKQVTVIGTKNFGWNMNAVMLLPAGKRHAYHARVLEAVAAENDHAAHAVSKEHFVDLIHAIAYPDGTVPLFTENGKLISQDRMHLTKDGARFVGHRLFEHPLLRHLKG